jgi:hypothetical protein
MDVSRSFFFSPLRALSGPAPVGQPRHPLLTENSFIHSQQSVTMATATNFIITNSSRRCERIRQYVAANSLQARPVFFS